MHVWSGTHICRKTSTCWSLSRHLHWGWPLNHGDHMEKGARSWTTGPLQGRWQVQVLCELHDSLGFCPTNIPKGGLERFERWGTSICQRRRVFLVFSGYMNWQKLPCLHVECPIFDTLCTWIECHPLAWLLVRGPSKKWLQSSIDRKLVTSMYNVSKLVIFYRVIQCHLWKRNQCVLSWNGITVIPPIWDWWPPQGIEGKWHWWLKNRSLPRRKNSKTL